MNWLTYGPVADPAGTYGIAVIEADDEEQVHTAGRSDPAVIDGVGTFEVFPMPAVVRSSRSGGRGTRANDNQILPPEEPRRAVSMGTRRVQFGCH